MAPLFGLRLLCLCHGELRRIYVSGTARKYWRESSGSCLARILRSLDRLLIGCIGYPVSGRDLNEQISGSAGSLVEQFLFKFSPVPAYHAERLVGVELMSRGARWMVGLFALFFAGLFFNAPPKSPALVYSLAAF